MGDKELTDISVHLHYVNERSVKVSDTGNLKDAVILPSSQIEIFCKNTTTEKEWHEFEGRTVEITLPIWLAKDKGLI